MNLQPSQRRQDSPVRLGNHGYRLDGDVAVLEAELHIPPHCSGSGFSLELWACPEPHSGGSPQGTPVAAVALELPTPIVPYLHRIEARAAARLPSGNAAHAMVLMLVSDADGRRVHDYTNYGRLQQFANPSLEGAVGYSVEGEQVVLRADGVANPRQAGNSSGTLCLELWAFEQPYAGGEPRGKRLAGAELGSVWGQYRLPEIERRVPFTPPSAGRWHLSLLLREWTLAHGYVTRDQRDFDALYEQAAPEPAAPEPAAPEPAAVLPPPPASPRAPEKLRLLERAAAPAVAAAPAAATAPAAVAPAPAAAVAAAAPKAQPAAAAVATAPAVAAVVAAAPSAALPAKSPEPAAAPKSGLVSLNTASIDELAKLPGLSLKVAKDIVKSRPFASIDALIQVRGVGEKTLRRIKSLLAL